MLTTFQNNIIDRGLEELTSWLLPHLVITIFFTVALVPWISKQWQELSSKRPSTPLPHHQVYQTWRQEIKRIAN